LSGQTVSAVISNVPNALSRSDHNLCAVRHLAIGVGNLDGILDNELDIELRIDVKRLPRFALTLGVTDL